MLWGHIDWDKMLQDIITELDTLEKLDISKESEISKELDLEKLFKDTLVDYAPYAIIRYDELPHEYARIFIPPDKRKKKKQEAIQRVHLKPGNELFKQTFLEKFSGKTLREFDKEFPAFVSDYLEKKKPTNYSLGLQAYNFHLNLSKFVVDWQSLDEVRYDDVSDKKSDLQILLEKYKEYGRKQMKELEKYQQRFDNLHRDIK